MFILFLFFLRYKKLSETMNLELYNKEFGPFCLTLGSYSHISIFRWEKQYEFDENWTVS